MPQQQQSPRARSTPVPPTPTKKRAIPSEFTTAWHSGYLQRFYSETYVQMVLRRADPHATVMNGRVFGIVMRMALARGWSGQIMLDCISHTNVGDVREVMYRIHHEEPELLGRLPNEVVRECVSLCGIFAPWKFPTRVPNFFTPANPQATMTYLDALKASDLAAILDELIACLTQEQPPVDTVIAIIRVAGSKNVLSWQHALQVASIPRPFADIVNMMVKHIPRNARLPSVLYESLICGSPQWCVPAMFPAHAHQFPVGGFASPLVNSALRPYILKELIAGWPISDFSTQTDERFGAQTPLHMLIQRLHIMARSGHPESNDTIDATRKMISRMTPAQLAIRDMNGYTAATLVQALDHTLIYPLFSA